MAYIHFTTNIWGYTTNNAIRYGLIHNFDLLMIAHCFGPIWIKQQVLHAIFNDLDKST
ncbi:hypothetical protein MARI151_50474 [Maribacter litoralis]|uniref:Uncharacterized protein n=1 Tax=Maribacter litoralis TaxID=2059726 RepID=A0A653VHP0_9FLAO|nr:hypothetical protein MARI151_50474 [Maribacter litoralis]